jgi:hypothetical protein
MKGNISNISQVVPHAHHPSGALKTLLRIQGRGKKIIIVGKPRKNRLKVGGGFIIDYYFVLMMRCRWWR